MKNLENYAESFMTQHEMFIHECDWLENNGLWNTEAFGQMEGYYTNDFAGIILRLIAADGNISEKEVEYINKTFGLKFSTDELIEVYKSCIDNVEESFEENFRSGLARLEGIDEKVAKLYKELVFMICEIIIESDGIVCPPERELAENIKDMCR